MKNKITLIDGGMGQEIVRRYGQEPTPLWSTTIMLENPELVETLHLDFIKAGAEIISLNNYTATPERLKRDASIDLFEPIHKAAIEIAHRARSRSSKPVKIGGCLPPLVASYKADVAPDYEACLSSYRRLVDVQNFGIDLFLCETLATVREARAACTAASETGKPVWVSFTIDDNNPFQLRSGESLAEAVKAVSSLGVESILINCSMPETVTIAMPELAAAFPRVGAYANGFQTIAGLEAGGTVAALKSRMDLTPERYADHVFEWIELGAQIVGGCCEVGPEHIAEINQRLER